MAEFSICDLQTHFNPSGWGPSNGEALEAFNAIPYAHFDKKERTWRAADFSAQGQAHSLKSPYMSKYSRRDEASSSNAEFAYQHNAAEDQTFQLVDTSKSQNKRYSSGSRPLVSHIYALFKLFVCVCQAKKVGQQAGEGEVVGVVDAGDRLVLAA